ncbi:arginyltransferase [Immundisolibacter sp.]|uniref:arginyltransferase n=1 Tax=Immundisolibacter sp. TaxID=1934948 RepID=UPI0019A873C2|nr:arginyltransferase [Immundisolibacter sp.]MBC7161424.1 arginyltransferase [Immundisolibacter sp.]
MIFNTRFGRLFFFSTEPQTCSYLPDREAVMLFADPNKVIDTETYARLIDYGFRRSGDNVYRPHCRGCTACVPVRIPVADFLPDRAQRRAWQRNQDLTVSRARTEFGPEHLDLYHRYQVARHDGRAGVRDAREQLEFLRSRFIDTSSLEYRLDGRLVMVSVIDQMPQGLSAVYTFYEADDAALARRSLGTFGVLRLIEECRKRNLPWLYLGYWIADSEKMAYKSRYQPLHAYQHGRWERLAPTDQDAEINP